MTLHELLSLKRPLFVLDCETTALDPATARVVEIGFQLWTPDGLQKEWCSLVDPGVPIPAEATKVHGITDDSMRRCRRCKAPLEGHPVGKADETIVATCLDLSPVPTFEQLATNLAKGFTDCDYAGKNIRFDLRVLAAEMARAGVTWSYAGARIVDADRLEQLGEPRTLSHLYERHLGRKMEGAHGALADARAAAEVIAAQITRYAMLPRDLGVLHEAQWPGWIDEDGKFRFVDGVPCFSRWGRYAGRPMRDADPSYWDFILSKNFPLDAKALARDAKLGKFPEGR